MTRLYYAGFTAFTLGMGDYIPNGSLWQALSTIALLTGLGLTTLAITYLVPVVSAVTDRRVQASTIAGLGATPQAMIVSAYRGDRFTFLDHRLPQMADSDQARRDVDAEPSGPCHARRGALDRHPRR